MSDNNAVNASFGNGSVFSWAGAGQLDLLIATRGEPLLHPEPLFPKLTDVPVRLIFNLPGFAPTDQVADSLGSYAEEIVKNQGLFNPLIKDATNGFINRTLFQTNKNYGNPSRLIEDADYYQKTMDVPLNTLNNIFNAPIDMKGVPYTIDFSKNNENNTLIFGPQSNTNVSLGDGNNLVLNSPAMFDQMSTIYTEGWDRNPFYPQYDVPRMAGSLNYILYPSMQGAKGTNTIVAGNGNNVIYYDSSFSQIKTGNGNNIFAPSFGSFNWAYNNFYPAEAILKVTSFDANYMKQWGTPQPSNGTWFTPIPQQAASEKSGLNQLYNGSDLYLISVVQFLMPRPIEFIYKGGSFGKPNNATDASNVVIAALTPTIGGMAVIGGNGNDTFYGVDPSFYSYNPSLDRGIAEEDNRTVFRLQSSNTTDERFSYQNFETVKFMGGGGNNIFNLGNPTKIQPDGLQFKGQYTYQISTSHAFLATEAQQKKLSYGNIDLGLNQINVNLATNVNSYTNTAQTFDPGSGTNTSTLNLPSAFSDIFDTLQDFSGVLKFLGPLATAIDVAQAVRNITTWIVGDPQPIKVNSTALTQPLGDWKHAIEVNDWNPGTVLNIAVDPTLTTAPDTARWNNIQFLIGTPNQSSDSVFGVSVKWQQGSDAEKTLFRLDGLGSSFYGYQSYNFATQKYQQIDQNNLAFFGTTAIGIDKINPLQNYTAGNGFVFSSSDPLNPSYSTEGSHLFYWNDVNNATIDLNAARLSARSISIEFDSRSLGWSWDPKLTSTLTDQSKNVTQEDFKKSLTLDVEKSKLWIEGDNGTWKYFTFSQFNTITEAYKSALLAKTFYQVNGQKPLISDDQQTTNDLVLSLSTLQKIVPDLSKLQQSGDATKLTSLQQITYVEDFSSGRKQGVNIYYKMSPTDTAVYKIFAAQSGNMALANDSLSQLALSQSAENLASLQAIADPLASAPVLVDKATLLEKEATIHIDIDLNNIVGFSLADILASGSYNLNAEIVSKTYETILERAADSAGFQAWSAALQAGADVGFALEGFLCSTEFLDQSGSKNEFIDDLYAFLLNRLPEEGARMGWVNALDNGASYNDVLRHFIESKEFASIIGTVQ